jgi:hypothetical protein
MGTFSAAVEAAEILAATAASQPAGAALREGIRIRREAGPLEALVRVETQSLFSR